MSPRRVVKQSAKMIDANDRAAKAGSSGKGWRR
jgi:hypothetical protein